MKVECKNKYKMDYSYLDKNLKYNYNAVWVVSKSKIHIYRNPTWLEIIHGESFTPLVKPIRIETETFKTYFAGTQIIKSISDRIENYSYEFGNVLDDDVQVPDLTGYEIQYNTTVNDMMNEVNNEINTD